MLCTAGSQQLVEQEGVPTLLQPSMQGRVTLNYQRLDLQPTYKKNISWDFNISESSCTSFTKFRVHLYTESDITNYNSHMIENTTSRGITINSTEDCSYCKVFAVDASGMPCAGMEYFQSLLLPGSCYS